MCFLPFAFGDVSLFLGTAITKHQSSQSTIMLSLYESEVEEWVMKLLREHGYTYLLPEEQKHARGDFSEVVFRGCLKDAVTCLNPDISEDELEYVLREVLG